MYLADDPRVDEWKTYIKVIQGPLIDGTPLETYATQAKTKAAIKEAQEAVRTSLK
jgi:hypothetical protein